MTRWRDQGIFMPFRENKSRIVFLRKLLLSNTRTRGSHILGTRVRIEDPLAHRAVDDPVTADKFVEELGRDVHVASAADPVDTSHHGKTLLALFDPVVLGQERDIDALSETLILSLVFISYGLELRNVIMKLLLLIFQDHLVRFKRLLDTLPLNDLPVDLVHNGQDRVLDIGLPLLRKINLALQRQVFLVCLDPFYPCVGRIEDGLVFIQLCFKRDFAFFCRSDLFIDGIERPPARRDDAVYLFDLFRALFQPFLGLVNFQLYILQGYQIS